MFKKTINLSVGTIRYDNTSHQLANQLDLIETRTNKNEADIIVVNNLNDNLFTAVNDNIVSSNANISGIRSDVLRIDNAVNTIDNNLSNVSNSVISNIANIGNVQRSVDDIDHRLVITDSSVQQLNTNLTTLQNTVTSIVLDGNDYSADINRIDIALNTVNGKLDINDTDITEIKTDIIDVKDQLIILTDNIDTINSTVTDDIASINDALTDGLTGLQTTVDTLTTNTSNAIDLLTVNVDNNVNAIANTNTTLTTLINTSIDTVTDSIAAVSDKANKYFYNGIHPNDKPNNVKYSIADYAQGECLYVASTLDLIIPNLHNTVKYAPSSAGSNVYRLSSDGTIVTLSSFKGTNLHDGESTFSVPVSDIGDLVNCVVITGHTFGISDAGIAEYFLKYITTNVVVKFTIGVNVTGTITSFNTVDVIPDMVDIVKYNTKYIACCVDSNNVNTFNYTTDGETIESELLSNDDMFGVGYIGASLCYNDSEFLFYTKVNAGRILTVVLKMSDDVMSIDRTYTVDGEYDSVIHTVYIDNNLYIKSGSCVVTKLNLLTGKFTYINFLGESKHTYDNEYLMCAYEGKLYIAATSYKNSYAIGACINPDESVSLLRTINYTHTTFLTTMTVLPSGVYIHANRLYKFVHNFITPSPKSITIGANRIPMIKPLTVNSNYYLLNDEERIDIKLGAINGSTIIVNNKELSTGIPDTVGPQYNLVNSPAYIGLGKIIMALHDEDTYIVISDSQNATSFNIPSSVIASGIKHALYADGVYTIYNNAVMYNYNVETGTTFTAALNNQLNSLNPNRLVKLCKQAFAHAATDGIYWIDSLTGIETKFITHATRTNGCAIVFDRTNSLLRVYYSNDNSFDIDVYELININTNTCSATSIYNTNEPHDYVSAPYISASRYNDTLNIVSCIGERTTFNEALLYWHDIHTFTYTTVELLEQSEIITPDRQGAFVTCRNNIIQLDFISESDTIVTQLMEVCSYEYTNKPLIIDTENTVTTPFIIQRNGMNVFEFTNTGDIITNAGSINERFNNIDNTIGSLTTDVTAVEDDLLLLTTTVSNNKTAIEGSVTSLTTIVTDNKTNTDNTITALTTRVDDLDIITTTLRTDLDDLTDVVNAGGTPVDIENRLAAVEVYTKDTFFDKRTSTINNAIHLSYEPIYVNVVGGTNYIYFVDHVYNGVDYIAKINLSGTNVGDISLYVLQDTNFTYPAYTFSLTGPTTNNIGGCYLGMTIVSGFSNYYFSTSNNSIYTITISRSALTGTLARESSLPPKISLMFINNIVYYVQDNSIYKDGVVLKTFTNILAASSNNVDKLYTLVSVGTNSIDCHITDLDGVLIKKINFNANINIIGLSSPLQSTYNNNSIYCMIDSMCFNPRQPFTKVSTLYVYKFNLFTGELSVIDIFNNKLLPTHTFRVILNTINNFITITFAYYNISSSINGYLYTGCIIDEYGNICALESKPSSSGYTFNNIINTKSGLIMCKNHNDNNTDIRRLHISSTNSNNITGSTEDDIPTLSLNSLTDYTSGAKMFKYVYLNNVGMVKISLSSSTLTVNLLDFFVVTNFTISPISTYKLLGTKLYVIDNRIIFVMIPNKTTLDIDDIVYCVDITVNKSSPATYVLSSVTISTAITTPLKIIEQLNALRIETGVAGSSGVVIRYNYTTQLFSYTSSSGKFLRTDNSYTAYEPIPYKYLYDKYRLQSTGSGLSYTSNTATTPTALTLQAGTTRLNLCYEYINNVLYVISLSSNATSGIVLVNVERYTVVDSGTAITLTFVALHTFPSPYFSSMAISTCVFDGYMYILVYSSSNSNNTAVEWSNINVNNQTYIKGIWFNTTKYTFTATALQKNYRVLDCTFMVRREGPNMVLTSNADINNTSLTAATAALNIDMCYKVTPYKQTSTPIYLNIDSGSSIVAYKGRMKVFEVTSDGDIITPLGSLSSIFARLAAASI